MVNRFSAIGLLILFVGGAASAQSNPDPPITDKSVTRKVDEVFKRKKFEYSVLTPAAVDSFRDAELGTIKFTRNAKNEVAGFELFAGRVRHLKFVRQTN